MLLAQVVETVGTLDEIRKADPTGVVYLFVLVVVLFAGGSFFLVKYLLNHTKDLHDTAHANIRNITERHSETAKLLTESFNAECISQREQHHKDTMAQRDMVHDACILAQETVSSKELNDKLSVKLAEHRNEMKG